jgi:hypothetical protein
LHRKARPAARRITRHSESLANGETKPYTSKQNIMNGNFFPALGHAFLHCQEPLSLHDFLDRVLPDGGLFCLAYTDAKGGGRWHHETFTNIDEIEKRLHALEAEDHWQIYFAPSSYTNEFGVAKADGKKWGRTTDNVAYSRCLWADIDVGDGKDYPDIVEAGNALANFIELTSLRPSDIVYSGTGLHVYYQFDRDLPANEWKTLAKKFKDATTHAGFRIDHSRTTDIASVLRPPFTTNRKNGRKNSVVAYRGISYATITVEQMSDALDFITHDGEGDVREECAKSNNTGSISLPWYAALGQAAREATLRSMLQILPKEIIEVDRQAWVKVAFSLFSEDVLPRTIQLQLLKEWSTSTDTGKEKWLKDSDDEHLKNFDKVKHSHIGVLIRMAEKAGWQPALIEDTSIREQVLEAQEKHNERWTDEQAREFLRNNVIYISSENGYLLDGDVLPKEALDNVLARRMPLSKNGEPKKASKMAVNSDVVFNAHRRGYRPGAKRLYVDDDGKTVANTYERLELVEEEAGRDDLLTFATYLKHLIHDDEETKTGIMRFLNGLAYLHINEGERIEYATVLVGPPGSGKSLLMERITRALFGRWNVRNVESRDLNSGFNGYMEGCRILVLSELSEGSRKDARNRANQMKSDITNPDISVTRKGLDPRMVRNHASFFASSNYYDAAYLDEDDRRYHVIETKAGRMPEGLSEKMIDLIENRPGVLLNLIKRFGKNGANFNPREAPAKTKARQRMIELSRPEWARQLRKAIKDGEYPCSGDLVSTTEIRTWLSKDHTYVPSSDAIRTELLTIFPDAVDMRAQKRVGGPRQTARLLCVRNIAKWKDAGPTKRYEYFEETILRQHPSMP